MISVSPRSATEVMLKLFTAARNAVINKSRNKMLMGTSLT